MRTARLALGCVLLSLGCSKAPAATSSGSPPGPASVASSAAAPGAAPSPPTTAPSPAVAAALAHPCGLLDNADIETALGTKDFAPQEDAAKDPVGNAHCTWHIPKGAGFAEVLLHHPSHQDRFDHLNQLTKHTPFPGVGDKAYVDPTFHWGHILVLKNGQTFMVQVSHGNVATGMTATTPEMQEQAVVLARKVAAKL